MLSAAFWLSFMLSVVMLNVVMLSVVASIELCMVISVILTSDKIKEIQKKDFSNTFWDNIAKML